MRVLALILMLAATPAMAHGPGWFHSHKVEPKVAIVNGVPVAIKTVEAKKADGVGKQVLRASGMSLAVGLIVGTVKAGIFVMTGIPLF